MNQQDRLAKASALRRNIDKGDLNAVRRKPRELGGPSDMFVPHRSSRRSGDELYRPMSSMRSPASERGREGGEPIWHRGDQNRLDLVVEAGQHDAPMRANAAPSANLPPTPAQAKRAFAVTRPSA